MGHRMGSDYFSIYLTTTLGDWVYINFEGGATNIQVVSSYEDINAMISSLELKKRTVKGEKKDQYIVYELGSDSKAVQFAKRMKQYGTK